MLDNYKVKGFETLDFRDIEAFDSKTAIIMSVDAPAFFFKTTDGGNSWKRKYMNRNSNVFFNAISFWNINNGIAFSDPIDGKFFIITTKDGGNNWSEISNINIPNAGNNETSFAASGTSLVTIGNDLVWFGTGGIDNSNIYFSIDAGVNWQIANSEISSKTKTSGVY